MRDMVQGGPGLGITNRQCNEERRFPWRDFDEGTRFIVSVALKYLDGDGRDRKGWYSVQIVR